MLVNNAYDLYEKITENQSMQPTEKKTPKKTMVIHNINAVTTLATQIEVLTNKLDNLYKNMNMVHQPAPVCKGCGIDHTTVSSPLASMHIYEFEKVSYAQNSQRQHNNLYSNMYNPGLRNHSNISWANNQGQGNQIHGNPQGFQHNQKISHLWMF